MFICHVLKEYGKLPGDHTIKLKISGDGARMTKLTTLQLPQGNTSMWCVGYP